MLVALVVWLTRDNTVRNVYELSTRDAVSGLQPQAMVRYRGIAVGKVTSIDFDPKVKGNVRVRITVDERVPLTTSTFATLSYQGVTGLAFIALDDKGESQVRARARQRRPAAHPAQALAAGAAAGSRRGHHQPGRGSDPARQHAAGRRQPEAHRRRAGKHFVGRGQREPADPVARQHAETGVNPALKALPPLMDRTKDALGTVKTAAGDVSRVANNLNTTVGRLNAADGPIDRLGDGTKALSQAVESFNNATLPRVNRVADDTSRAVRRLGRAADGINDNPQSLLFGNGGAVAGPGEPGFSAPAAAAARP